MWNVRIISSPSSDNLIHGWNSVKRARIVHWRPEEAGPLLQAVRSAGYHSEYANETDGGSVTRAITRNPPDVLIVDLSRLPSHGREVAVWLRGRKATRHIPIVFVGGQPEKVAATRQIFPDSTYTTLEALGGIAVFEAPTHPVIPVRIMDRYKGRTAAQKMGVQPGSKVGIVEPPRDYLTVLGDLPEGTELIEEPDQPQPVTIWFLHEPEPFLASLRQMRAIASKTKLWLLWRKGAKNGISQNFVREAAIDAGLVDYKICAVDWRWSGIAFARKKA